MVTTRSTKRATSQIPKIIIFRHYRLINSTAGEESPEMQPFPVEEIPRQGKTILLVLIP
jgi:hypothetical protein